MVFQEYALSILRVSLQCKSMADGCSVQRVDFIIGMLNEGQEVTKSAHN